MKRILTMMAAALLLAATQVSAQGGGAGSGGAGGATGAGAEQGRSGEDRTGAGATGGAASDRASQGKATQEAPSVTGTEGAGGKVPQPQAQEQGGERRYGNAPAQQSGPEGRPATQTPAQATTAPAQPAAPGQPAEVSGRVALVSTADGEIGIDAGTVTTQVRVAPDAQITVDGKKSSLKDIHQGAMVRAALEPSEDGLQAKRIEVTSSAKSPGPRTPATGK